MTTPIWLSRPLTTIIGEEFMKRWHEDYTVSKRQWKKHRHTHVENNKNSNNRIGLDPYVVDCACDEQIGRFRKKDAFDCGNAECYLCHSDKLPKRSKTEQEVRSDASFKEQLREV